MNYNTSYIQHHGVKGMKWGVRRYQNYDGTWKNAKEATAKAATKITGKQYADSYIKKGTTLNRIQTVDYFEEFPFYSTYMKNDSDKYMGLFGTNLKRRAKANARHLTKEAKKTDDYSDDIEAEKVTENAKNMKIYQLNIETVKKLSVPSDDNASNIMKNLMHDEEFLNDMKQSIDDSQTKMKRPRQQMLFKEAKSSLRKNIDDMSKEDVKSIYKAFNLSLVYHNDYEIRAQDKFYKQLKKNGYDAILDHNDKTYSSYHAKRPMIVFNTSAVKLKSVTETNPETVKRLYKKYNRERIIKEIPSNTISYIKQYNGYNIKKVDEYVNNKLKDYLK